MNVNELALQIVEAAEDEFAEFARQAHHAVAQMRVLGEHYRKLYMEQGAELGALREEVGRVDAVAMEQMRMAENKLLADDGEGMEPAHYSLLQKAQAYLKEHPRDDIPPDPTTPL